MEIRYGSLSNLLKTDRKFSICHTVSLMVHSSAHRSLAAHVVQCLYGSAAVKLCHLHNIIRICITLNKLNNYSILPLGIATKQFRTTFLPFTKTYSSSNRLFYCYKTFPKNVPFMHQLARSKSLWNSENTVSKDLWTTITELRTTKVNRRWRGNSPC